MLPFNLSRPLRFTVRWAVTRDILPFNWGAVVCRREFRTDVLRGRPPATFAEKVRYKLLRDRRPIARTFADKVAVRDYVQSCRTGLRLPRLLGIFDHEDEVVAGMPREPWVMKASHGSSMVLLSPKPGAVPAEEVRAKARSWLETDYALLYWEWEYFRLPRRILFEEYLGDGQDAPADYKFYVIHGQVRFIAVDQARFTRHTRDFFRPDWSWIDGRMDPYPFAPVRPARPPQLQRMLGIAETLAGDTDFLRVDLYLVRGHIYFGELTHSPYGGFTSFEKPEVDAELTGCWRVPAAYDKP